MQIIKGEYGADVNALRVNALASESDDDARGVIAVELTRSKAQTMRAVHADISVAASKTRFLPQPPRGTKIRLIIALAT